MCLHLGSSSAVWKTKAVFNSHGLVHFCYLTHCVYMLSFVLTLLLLNTACPVLANSVDPDQLASEEANWSGSALFVIKYVNFYQNPGLAEIRSGRGILIYSTRVNEQLRNIERVIFIGSRQVKRCIWTSAKCADSDHPALAQTIIQAFSSFIYSVVSKDSVSGQWRSLSNYADVPADLGLCIFLKTRFRWAQSNF